MNATNSSSRDLTILISILRRKGYLRTLNALWGLILSLVVTACSGGGGGGSGGSTPPPANQVTSAAATTDQNGQATLPVAGQNVTFQFVDQVTGSPVPGLSVAIGADPNQPSSAVLVVADAFSQYPFQIKILQGSASTTTTAAALSTDTTSQASTVSVPVQAGSGTVLSAVINTLQTGILPSSTSSATNDFSSAFLSSMKAFSAGVCQVALLPTCGFSPAQTTQIPVGDAKDYLLNSTQQAVTEGVPMALLKATAETFSEGAAGLPPMIEELAPAAVNAGLVTIWEKTGATYVNFTKYTLNGVTILVATPVYPGPPTNPFPPNPDLQVSATNSTGQPLSGGSLELFSKPILGLGIKAVLDTNGKADIAVPVGDYTGDVEGSGSEPADVSVTVPSGGTSLNVSLQPPAVAKVTLTANPGLTGFLAPGTQVQFTAMATDANGNVVPCNPVFIASNPVGSNVATIGPQTGGLTVGPDQGAASVTARCGGVTSNAILVSGSGSGQPQPPPPSSSGFDGTYNATVTTTSPLGTTTGNGTITVTNGQVSDPSGAFTGTVNANGQFTGTWSAIPGCVFTMSGTFSLTNSFTISSTGGCNAASGTIVAMRQ